MTAYIHGHIKRIKHIKHIKRLFKPSSKTLQLSDQSLAAFPGDEISL